MKPRKEDPDTDNDRVSICDHAVAFIDLLGQKAAMHSRYLPEDSDEALEQIKKSVGRIVGTQQLFERFYDAFSNTPTIHTQLPHPLQKATPDMANGELKWQYFSDGLVMYVPLGAGLVASPVNSIFALLISSGLLCLAGLAARAPIRGGIDVAWAVEYRPNQIYGSAVAHAYELESTVAQWPRVVVGEGLIDYLNHYRAAEGDDISTTFRRQMADRCLALVTQDIDKRHIVDYLGPSYRAIAKDVNDAEMIKKAKEFASSQLAHWQSVGNKKLEERYSALIQYFSDRSR